VTALATYIKRPLRSGLFIALLSMLGPNSFAQLIVGEGFTAKVLVGNVLVGDGVETNNIKYSGHPRAVALFENGDSCELGLDKGIILSSGVATECKGPNNTESNTKDLGYPGNPTLQKITGTTTFDAAVLEFDFKPQTSEVEFKYIFSSEEYIKYVDRNFNDVFGFYISGPGITGEQNVAKIPGSNVEVTIDNVNHKRNTAYFQMNDDTSSRSYKYLQHNAQTVVLKADLKLEACKWYTIKLMISDVGDPDLDSWVFIGSKSFKHKTGLGSDTAFCSNNFIQTLDAGHPTRDVLWSTGERTQQIQVSGYGKYTVEIFTECGSFKDEVVIYPAIRPINLGEDTIICGNEVDQNLGITNRVFDTYLWSTGDTTKTIHAKKPGEYWVEVGRQGCFARDTILLDSLPVPHFSLGADTIICGDVDFNIRPDRNGDDFTWDDGSKSGIRRITSPGAYWLRLDNGVCHAYDTITVTNRTDLDVNIGPPELVYCNVQEVRLTTQINDTSTYDVTWNTGDKVGAIRVNEAGDYSVTVRDKICDFVASDECRVVYLSEGLEYYVPNAFSPNGDDLNETFGIAMGLSEVDDFEINVYNRWGERVFRTTDINQKWDGTYNGLPAEPGVYMWYARVDTPCLPDLKRYQKGTLTLTR